MGIWRGTDQRIHWTWRLITYIVMFIIVLALAQRLVPSILRKTPLAVSRVAAATVMVAATVGVTYLWRRRLDRRPFADLGFTRGSALQLVTGFTAGAAGMILVALIGAALGWVRFAGWETTGSEWLSVAGGLAVALAPAMAVGICEELAMRGYLLSNFREGRPLWMATLWTGLIFAVLHGMSFVAVSPFLVFIVSATLMSVAFSIGRIVTGSLWLPIGFHAAWNWTQTKVLGFTINPRADYSRALVHLDIGGSELWLGGSGMPEGGLLTLLVVAAITAAAWLLTRGRIDWRSRNAS